jgi:hypothetical protein
MSRSFESLMRVVEGRDRRARIAGLLLVAAVATVLRVWVAVNTYPARLDAGHFVQYGVELANGNTNVLLTNVSVIPALLAAAACKVGVDPSLVVQYSTVLFGIVATLAAVWVGCGLFGAWAAGLAGGLLMAVNPSLVNYSTNGMGEMPFICLALIGLSFFVRWLRGEGNGLYPVLAFGLFGAGMYSRPFESILLAFIVMVYTSVRLVHLREWKRMLWLIAGLAVFVALLAPLQVYTARKTSSQAPSSKIFNVAFGEHGYDSKAIDALNGPMQKDILHFQEVGLVRYVWERRGEMAARFGRNVLRMMRFTRDQVFLGPFHFGNGWLMILILGLAWMKARTGSLRDWVLPVCIGFFIPLAACISFVHPRWVTTSVAFVLLILGDGLVVLVRSTQRSAVKAGLVAILVLWGLANAKASLDLIPDHWLDWNVRPIAQELKKFGSEDDILMTKWPQLPIEFYKHHPLKYVEMPYGRLDEVEAYAATRGVTLIALSNGRFGHWPFGKLFDGAPPPANWELLAANEFSLDDKRYGVETERWLLYRRHPVSKE